ncbi:hypothetical protein ABI_21450 [Asticcacaulis biprosthecium C19]|uniref:Uncharacterized protein n=1 Tax=Asticcacaulis biprosthecium C19 TaxID=715226 RepID=F4QGM2_9CAUL|nr:hypothetical protein ABI_21450 [Asticcacaulis biprosthecium C19]
MPRLMKRFDVVLAHLSAFDPIDSDRRSIYFVLARIPIQNVRNPFRDGL